MYISGPNAFADYIHFFWILPCKNALFALTIKINGLLACISLQSANAFEPDVGASKGDKVND